MRLKSFIAKSKIVQRTYEMIFSIIGILPVKKNVIVFESFMGKQYSCNPRAIFEYLQQNHPEYKCYWSVDRRHMERFIQYQNVFILPRFSVKWLLLMPRANYWVSNSRMPSWIKKPKHTIYLQTWHGTPLKKLGIDIEEIHMPGTTTEKYRENFKKESSKWDYLISPNQYSSEIFKRAFDFKGELLLTGYPRNDYLIANNSNNKICILKKRLGIPEEKKVILYAPTWRDDEYYGVGKYKLNLNLDMDSLYEQFKSEYVIILRTHYLVSSNNLSVLEKYKGFLYDFSSHNDIKELYLISDILITDYSSVFFDYLCLDRPIFHYTYDLESYRDKLRGFYFDLERYSPGPLLFTTLDIIESIKGLSKGFIPNISHYEFKDKYCGREDGNSTKRVVEKVFKPYVKDS